MKCFLPWLPLVTLLFACGKSPDSPPPPPSAPAAAPAAPATDGGGVRLVDEDRLFDDMADVADRMATAILADTGDCDETARKLAALVPAQQSIKGRTRALRGMSTPDDLARLKARGEADPRLKAADRKEALDKKTSELVARCRDHKDFQEALQKLGLKMMGNQ